MTLPIDASPELNGSTGPLPWRFQGVTGNQAGAGTVGAIGQPSAHHDRRRPEGGAELLTIRPIEPEDREALAEGFEKLSPESRYRRFFSPVTHLGDQELDYLTQVDHHDHEALVAVDPKTGEGVAVARYIRIATDVAEPAIVVADDWQQRGVGRVLLEALADRAREEGIRRFLAPVLAGNTGAIKAFTHLGATTHERIGTEVELRIELTEPAQATPALRELLRAMAAGLLQPARGVWELLLRQRMAPDGFGKAIIVGIDESEAALVAVDQARELAGALRLPVHLVGAHRPLLDDPAAIEAALGLAERRLRSGGVEVTVRRGRGDPAFAILSAAVQAQAGLIVLGSPPPPETSPILRSDVWNQVAHGAVCSVLIARAGGVASVVGSGYPRAGA